ncbi:hypothetical protein [Sodalis-like endosymbiont of Proechinophthirus fluctus]|uniref:hypothetical protein n=1 Tax=Sodalis-like endosymbiont of Proechinophthirus fluctus TaxID=1462730 RepID=UPI003F74C342
MKPSSPLTWPDNALNHPSLKEGLDEFHRRLTGAFNAEETTEILVDARTLYIGYGSYGINTGLSMLPIPPWWMWGIQRRRTTGAVVGFEAGNWPQCTQYCRVPG